MELLDRIKAFATLGDEILGNVPITANFWQTVIAAHQHNPWFTPENCQYAIKAIAREWLLEKNLTQWVSGYPSAHFNPKNCKNVGVVMAGNVPFVGFHDLLCVLMSGHHFVGKISSKDGGLMEAVINLLISIEPQFKQLITISEDKLEHFDAVIATGSDNSARYFEYYFGKYPNIIRKNRHSIAILTGNETDVELAGLASDIFTHFGLGCRNVSKLLVPKDYDFNRLLNALNGYRGIINHNKYANNYEYHRAIFLMNRIEHLDTGFVLVKPDEGLGSPVGTLYYQHYSNLESVSSYINSNAENLQCIVSVIPQITSRILPGNTQNPQLHHYADGIDTVEFLASL